MSVGTQQNKNYYAIHYIGDKEDVIVHNWPACLEARRGYPNLFKKFETDEAARRWLASITPEQEHKHLQTMEYVNAKNANKVQRTVWIDTDLLAEVEVKLSHMNVKLTDLVEDLLRDYIDDEDAVEGDTERAETTDSCEVEDAKVVELRESALDNIDKVELSIRNFTRYPSSDDYRKLVVDIHNIVRSHVELKYKLFGNKK